MPMREDAGELALLTAAISCQPDVGSTESLIYAECRYSQARPVAVDCDIGWEAAPPLGERHCLVYTETWESADGFKRDLHTL